MNEERPVVFTITPLNDGTFKIYTKDMRVDCDVVVNSLYSAMVHIAELYNNEGYAVLFEVD